MRQVTDVTASAVRASARQVLVERMVDNPMLTDGLAASGTGHLRIAVTVNLVTRIGGLARVQGLNAAQIEAAARYRQLWEAAQLGGGQAIDYGRVRVDTSGPGADGGLGGAIDALDGYRRAVQAVGMIGAALLDQVVCQEMSLVTLAARRGCVTGHARQALKTEVMRVLDMLARHLRLVSGGNKPA